MGQLLEAAYYHWYLDMHDKYSDAGIISLPMSVSNAVKTYSTASKISNSYADDNILCRYQAKVTLNGANILHTASYVNCDHHTNVPVEANYGIIRVFQSKFVACESVSSTTRLSGQYNYIPSMRYGNCKGLGEMEMTQLKDSGFRNVLQELADRSGMCVVNVCYKCTCIQMLCECVPAGSVDTSLHKDYHVTFECKITIQTLEFMITCKVGMNAAMNIFPRKE